MNGIPPNKTTDDLTRFAGAGEVAVRTVSVKGMKHLLPARLYVPSGAGQSGMIVFFPSGGFVVTELEEADLFLRMLALRSGCRVLASAYTVASVQPFPAAVEDAHAVLVWTVRNRRKLDWDGSRLMVAGIEAGGNIAAVSALMARDRCGPTLSAQLLLMPMLDPGLTTGSMRSVLRDRAAERAADFCAAGYRGYLPRALDRTHPYACPLQTSRMKGLPPALILSAAGDPLCDEAEQYGAKLKAAGIDAVIKRLPSLELEQPQARCSCAQKDNVLREMTAFIAGLEKDA